MQGRLAASLVLATLAAGCSGGHSSQPSTAASRPAPLVPADRSTTVELGSSMTIRGVTVSFDRIEIDSSNRAELVIGFANHAGRTLELNSYRVVVRQGGRRIVATGDGGGAVAVGLVNDASERGFSVLLPGFRRGLPYTVTATVTKPDDEPESSSWRPLPFAFRFGAV